MNRIELPLDTAEGHEIHFNIHEYSPTGDVMYGKAKLGNINELIKGASKSSVTDHPVRIEPSEEFHGQTEKNGKFMGLR